jgi:hypothetical protein
MSRGVLFFAEKRQMSLCQCGNSFLMTRYNKKFCSKQCSDKFRPAEYRRNNRTTVLFRTNKWRLNNREKLKSLIRKMSDNLEDAYIKGLLRHSGFKSFPPELIELKRNHIKLLRTIKQKQ